MNSQAGGFVPEPPAGRGPISNTQNPRNLLELAGIIARDPESQRNGPPDVCKSIDRQFRSQEFGSMHDRPASEVAERRLGGGCAIDCGEGDKREFERLLTPLLDVLY